MRFWKKKRTNYLCALAAEGHVHYDPDEAEECSEEYRRCGVMGEEATVAPWIVWVPLGYGAYLPYGFALVSYAYEKARANPGAVLTRSYMGEGPTWKKNS